MPRNARRFAQSLARTAMTFVATASLGGATLLIGPATSSAEPAVRFHQHAWGMTAPERAASLEQRIRTLHASLRITAAQELHWSSVAKVMRVNDLRLQGMLAARAGEPPHRVSAPEDLQLYERISQAHVDGLKALRGTFAALYAAMPDDQKLRADEAFGKFGNGYD